MEKALTGQSKSLSPGERAETLGKSERFLGPSYLALKSRDQSNFTTSAEMDEFKVVLTISHRRRPVPNWNKKAHLAIKSSHLAWSKGSNVGDLRYSKTNRKVPLGHNTPLWGTQLPKAFH